MLYQQLQPYIKINQIQNAKEYELEKIEINSADSLEWISLRGIGPVYASRICKFRSCLGGFADIDQLYEVYHLPKETIESIRPFLEIDTLLVKKINLAYGSTKELSQHPYCNFELAKELIAYRSQVGKIVELNEIQGILKEHDSENFINYLKLE